MNGSERISEAIGLLDEAIIEEANARRTAVKKSGIPVLIKLLSAAACIGIIAGAIAIAPRGGDTEIITITEGTTTDAPAAVSAAAAPKDTASAAGNSGDTAPKDTAPKETSVSEGYGTEPPEMTDTTTFSSDTSLPGNTESETTAGTEISEAPPQKPVIASTAERVPVVIPEDRRLLAVQKNSSPIAEASYPETAKRPKLSYGSDKEDYERWLEESHARYNAGSEIRTPEAFYKASAAEFLADSGEKNRVYSPVNAYIALALLAETAGGESRYQILDLLGEKDMYSLRSQVKNIWNAHYIDDGRATSLLANSLWLDDGLRYDPDTADFIAENYLASLYGGDLSSKETQKALKDWINKQTGGLLKDSVNRTELPPETLMTICSTIYFRAKWSYESRFDPNSNDTKIFRAVSGDTEAEFMNSTDFYKEYFRGEDYGAIELYFESGGSMWFILPDEDSTADGVLASGEYLEMVSRRGGWRNKRYLKINYSVPKFDVSSDLDLADSLKKLGVSDVFDSAAADFSPLTDDALFIDKVQHSARVRIDEEGCVAAAFTLEAGAGAALPPEVEEIDFILDRPFIFVITGNWGQPLFIGVVNKL